MEGIMKYINLSTSIVCFGGFILSIIDKDLQDTLIWFAAACANLELYFLKRKHGK
jgi:hypothetical protein